MADRPPNLPSARARLVLLWVLWPFAWMPLAFVGLVAFRTSLPWLILPWWSEDLAYVFSFAVATAGAMGVAWLLTRGGVRDDFRPRLAAEAVDQAELGFDPTTWRRSYFAVLACLPLVPACAVLVSPIVAARASNEVAPSLFHPLGPWIDTGSLFAAILAVLLAVVVLVVAPRLRPPRLHISPRGASIAGTRPGQPVPWDRVDLHTDGDLVTLVVDGHARQLGHVRDQDRELLALGERLASAAHGPDPGDLDALAELRERRKVEPEKPTGTS